MRQLDAAIAEALGYKVEYGLLEYPEGEDCDYWVDELNVRLPHYSTDGNAMIELVSQLRKKFLFSQRKQFVRYIQEYASQDLGYLIHTAELIWFITPDIVSKATYKALTGKDWGGGE